MQNIVKELRVLYFHAANRKFRIIQQRCAHELKTSAPTANWHKATKLEINKIPKTIITKCKNNA